MSISPEISAQIIQGINPLRHALQTGISRVIVHASEALVAAQYILQSELLWDYLLLVVAVWILSSAAIVCFWFGWVLGTNIYGLGMWLMGRSVVNQRRVRMVAKHTSGKNKLGGKKSSPTEVSGSGQIQVSEDVDHSLVADNTSGSGSQKEVISATSRSSTAVSHPVSAFEIGDSTPDKTPHMHAPVNLDETDAADNTALPLAVLINQKTAPGSEIATVFSDANTPSKTKNTRMITCAAMDGLTESPISTAKGLVGLLTPPSTPVRSLVMELQAAGAITPPHGAKATGGGEGFNEKDPLSLSTLTTPTQASVSAKRGRKRAPYKRQALRRHVMEDAPVEAGNKNSAP